MYLYNNDKILKLISEIRNSINRLIKIKEIGEDEFIKNQDKIDSTKYNFIVAIESAINICNHIISQNGFRAPSDYGDAFIVLGEQGAFDEVFVDELRSMVKFRNRLIHLYWDVDDKQVYSFIHNNLNDFKVFINKITVFLNM